MTPLLLGFDRFLKLVSDELIGRISGITRRLLWISHSVLIRILWPLCSRAAVCIVARLF